MSSARIGPKSSLVERRIFHAAFSELGQKKLLLMRAHSVVLAGLHWSEGRRSRYAAVRISDLKVVEIVSSSLAPWDEELEGKAIDVLSGLAIAVMREGPNTYGVLYVRPEEELK